MSDIEPPNNDDLKPGNKIISSKNSTSVAHHSLSQSKSGDENISSPTNQVINEVKNKKPRPFSVWRETVRKTGPLTAVGFPISSFLENERQISINNSITGGSTEGNLADIGRGNSSVDGQLPMEKGDPCSNRPQFSQWQIEKHMGII
jgi:hypothetical protein